MFRDADFFPFSAFWTDKSLRWSLAIWGVVLAIASGMLFGYLAKQTIFVDKIANVTIVSKQEAERLGRDAIPISEIGMALAKDSPPVLTGYAANVVDVCKSGDFKPDSAVILLTKANTGFAAVSTKLDTKVCSIFLRNRNAGDTVWAVSDTAFKDIESKQSYIVLNGGHESDGGLMYLRQ